MSRLDMRGSPDAVRPASLSTVSGMVRPRDHAAFGRRPDGRSVDIDAPIEWGCSLKGWNCCVGTAIEVRPYDMIRLRHALRRPAQEIANAGLVEFAWHPQHGTLAGSLAHEPFDGGPPGAWRRALHLPGGAHQP